MPTVPVVRMVRLVQCRFESGKTAVGCFGSGRDDQREADIPVYQGGFVAQFGGHTGVVEQPRVQGRVVARGMGSRAAEEGGGQPGEALGMGRRGAGASAFGSLISAPGTY